MIWQIASAQLGSTVPSGVLRWQLNPLIWMRFCSVGSSYAATRRIVARRGAIWCLKYVLSATWWLVGWGKRGWWLVWSVPATTSDSCRYPNGYRTWFESRFRASDRAYWLPYFCWYPMHEQSILRASRYRNRCKCSRDATRQLVRRYRNG